MPQFESIMEINISDLLTVFDDILPQSLEDGSKERYTFVCKREEGFIIYFHISPYDMYSHISLDIEGQKISAVEFLFCKKIQVLDPSKKIVEIIAGSKESLNIRCLFELTGQNRWIEIETQYEYHLE